MDPLGEGPSSYRTDRCRARGSAARIVGVVLELTEAAYVAMIGHAYDGLPDEACGLMIGPAAGVGQCLRFEPCRNAAESSRIYSIEAKEFMRIDREAERAGEEIIGVMHSHTHTEPYPSQTDVNQAPDPSWHYVIVSLRDIEPMLRSYRIVDGGITEEPVVVVPG